MLGYEARVHELAADVSEEDLHRIDTLPFRERNDYVSTLTSRQVAHVPYRTWVDDLLTVSGEGRARMLQNGGYPYLFHAQGEESKTNFARAGLRSVSALIDETWYFVEAWDQS